MTRPGSTYIGLILDRSGSMERIREDMEGALNQFIDDQKQLPGDCQVTLVQFDNVVETVFEHRDIQSVDRIELHPRNMTALLDAIGTTINRLGAHFIGLSEDERPEKVLIVTITDGLENSSTEFTHDQVKALIDEQTTKWNWAFTYLGANQDAVVVAHGLGVKSAMTYGATPTGTRSVGSALSNATSRFRSEPVASASFGYTADEEEEVAETVTS